MVFLNGDYPGNVLMDFEARTVPPSSHDIDFMWNGSWDDRKNQRGVAYVGGIEGWWDGKVGIERSPEYKLVAATPLFDFRPGQVYRIQGGSIEGHCFIFVDGRLLVELTDPDPIDSTRFAKVGFEGGGEHPGAIVDAPGDGRLPPLEGAPEPAVVLDHRHRRTVVFPFITQQARGGIRWEGPGLAPVQ